MTLPIQPLITDTHGTLRFEKNPIVEYLLEAGPFDMNHLSIWCINNDIEDKYREQFAQLIGYSLSGFGTLSYVSDETYERANSIRLQSLGDSVIMPKNADQAQLMANLGIKWLQDNAPDRLTEWGRQTEIKI